MVNSSLGRTAEINVLAVEGEVILSVTTILTVELLHKKWRICQLQTLQLTCTTSIHLTKPRSTMNIRKSIWEPTREGARLTMLSNTPQAVRLLSLRPCELHRTCRKRKWALIYGDHSLCNRIKPPVTPARGAVHVERFLRMKRAGCSAGGCSSVRYTRQNTRVRTQLRNCVHPFTTDYHKRVILQVSAHCACASIICRA